jgi:hypothetical protein
MLILLTLLLMVAVVVGLRVMSRRRAMASDAALTNVAAALGFEESRSDGLGGPLPRGGRHAKAPPRRRRWLAEAATMAWGVRRALHGQWNGRAVSVGALPARRYRVAVAAAHQWPSTLGLWAQPASSILDTPPTRLERVHSGDDVFDHTVHVCGLDRPGVEALLRRAAVRRALSDLMHADATALVADGWVQARPYHDALGDVAVVRQMLDTVTQTADALDRARADEA